MSGLSSLWSQSSTETFGASHLQGDDTADLAIIGGGFTGCSAALEAAAQGADVILIEAQGIGHGGSGRNVGLVNAGLWLPPDEVCQTLGAEAGEHLNRVLSEAPEAVFSLINQYGIACEPTRNGTLHLAHAPGAMTQLETRHDQMAARAAPVTLLDAAEARARTGTAQVHGALHDARAGTIQPLAYVQGLARAAKGQGARIHENTPALSAAQHGGQWIIRTPSGKIRAKRLLVATNAYHEGIQNLRMPDASRVNFFQLATEPLGDNLAGDILRGGEGCWDTGLVMSSLRRDKAGRIILGGMGDDTGIQANWARRKLCKLFPHLAEAKITHAWAGRISMTYDHLPRILRIGGNGMAVFGYSGRGIAPGTVFGTSIARALLTGEERDLPIAPVDQHNESFTTVKSVFFEAGARLKHLIEGRG
ncbi:FAD-binding oxidoreductase [Roseovarius sp. MMSF_3281]|uniref:NAD(P)/FAD-dependent oxidoreductase n=1 Tax=Roseovarius sp. MMSF_3281 TaxID=3046694 RepID=UPI00273EE6EE|nr:FAD-binding oxidoreductase [Roseovarius sp. MMSF_3281]